MRYKRKNPRKFSVGDLVSHVNGYPQGPGTVTHVAEYVGRRDQSVTVKWPPQEFKETYSSSALTLVKKNPASSRTKTKHSALLAAGRYEDAAKVWKRSRAAQKRKNPEGGWVPLTLSNAYDNAPIINRDHPEWGEKRLRYEGGFWIHWSNRGSATLDPSEFRFWLVKPGHEGSRGVGYAHRHSGRRNPLTSGLGDTYAIMHANPRSLPVKAAAFPSIRHASGWHTYRLVQRLSGGRGTDKSAIFFAPDNAAARNHASKVLFDGARAIRLERAV